MPGLPGKELPGKKTGEKDKEKEDTKKEDTKKEGEKKSGLPLVDDLGQIPGRALDLIGRELGLGTDRRKSPDEDPADEKKKGEERKKENPEEGEKTKLPEKLLPEE